jgi:hypothetical protein
MEDSEGDRDGGERRAGGAGCFFSEGGGCRMILGESMRDGFGNVLER